MERFINISALKRKIGKSTPPSQELVDRLNVMVDAEVVRYLKSPPSKGNPETPEIAERIPVLGAEDAKGGGLVWEGEDSD
jgi:hypothetical protein